MIDLIKGVDFLLNQRGLFIFEEPYLGSMYEKTSYDQIYDEHVFLFSALSVSYLFNLYDMELIDLYQQKTHGGSMRYVLAKRGAYNNPSLKDGDFMLVGSSGLANSAEVINEVTSPFVGIFSTYGLIKAITD